MKIRPRFAVLALASLLAAGCSLFPAPPPTPGGIADTDKTFSTPMRTGTNESEPQNLPWYDLRKYMDPRSQQIERHLGAI